MTSVAAEFEHMEIQQQYNDGVNNRWDADDWDNENSSARLFERSRIKALAGRTAAGERTGVGGMSDLTFALYVDWLEVIFWCMKGDLHRGSVTGTTEEPEGI